MTTCGGCGQSLAADARFCSSCGAPLAPAREEVRKVVTVVFCDLVGSTALGERSDPEVLRSLMARYHAELRRVLEAHGGTVEKFVGDAAMAVFGIPSVHEDDAVRAVRAAVAMRDAVVPLGLQVRIGVNTGEVVAGIGETLVTGDAVNVAARLEQSAEAGDVLIGSLTERLAREDVVAEPVEPLTVKGKSEPVAAFRVVGLRRRGRDDGRSSAAFLGRSDELAQLESLLANVTAARTAHLVTVVGEPGIGKSRLVAELLSRVDGEVLVGRCLPYGDAVTYWPIVEILEGVGDVEAVIDRAGDDPAVVSVRLAAAMGNTGAAASPEEISWAFRRLLESLARERSVVVVFDDVHWAQPALLDLIEYVASFAQDVPLLVLCTARPELFDDRPAWAAPRQHATVIRLEPLAADAAQTLAGTVPGVTDAVRQQIVEAADGNPLFIEQLVAMHVEAPERPLEVPPNLQALLAARIDRLQAQERLVVERASVEGRLFHRGAVVELLPETERSDVGARLIGLVRRELIQPDRATLAGDDAFRFGHILIRDAAYDSIPKRVRAELHERYARWLLDRLGAEAPPEIVGYHLAQAHDYLTELGNDATAVGNDAASYLAAAAYNARLRQDVRAARKALQRAVAVCADDKARGELLIMLAFVCYDTGEVDVEDESVRQAAEIAERIADTRIAQLARIASLFRRMRRADEGATQAAKEAATQIIAEADPADHVLLARAWELLAETRHMEGRIGGVDTPIEKALREARAAGDRALEIRLAGSWVPTIVYGAVPVDEGLARLDDFTANLGDVPSIQALSLHVLGHLRARRGEFDDAAELLGTWRNHLRELGQELMFAVTASCVWDVMVLAGDYAEGERALREGFEILDRMGDKTYRNTNAAFQGQAALLQGRIDEAERLALLSRDMGTTDDVLNEALWRSLLARVHSERGRHDEARELARAAVDILESTSMLDARGDAYLDLAEVLRCGGDEPGAASAAQAACALYEQKGNLVGVRRAAALGAQPATADAMKP